MKCLVIKESTNPLFNKQYPIGSIIKMELRNNQYYAKDIDHTLPDWYIDDWEEGNFKCIDIYT